jgi:hypothetical protein
MRPQGIYSAMTSKTTLCGAVDLLSAIFERDRDVLRERYGIPIYPHCTTCGKQLYKNNKTGYCKKCPPKSKIIMVECSGCGKLFQTTTYDIIHRIQHKHSDTGLYCSKQCWGKYIGKNYGFAVHPTKK